MTGSGQSHDFLDDKTNTGKGIVIMDRNTTKYKVKQYIMFAGISTVLFAAVVIIPFIYGLYLTFTSWDGISKDKQFVGFANYIATFKDIAYWQALGRTVIYSVISVVLVNVVAFFLAYLLHAIYCFLAIIWQILDGNSAAIAIFLTRIWQNITPGKSQEILLEITLCACYGASHGALLRWHIGTGLLPRDEFSGGVCRCAETLRSRICGKFAEPGKPEERLGIVPKPRFASPSRKRTV